MRIVIVGGGFAGVSATESLIKKGFEVVLINETEYMIYTPLLSMSASKEIPEETIRVKIKELFNHKNFRLVIGKVDSINTTKKSVKIGHIGINYDKLILAPGSTECYRGIKGAKENSVSIKQLRSKIKSAKKIIIIGGGPTGIELSADLAKKHKVVLVHSKKELLNDFPSYFRNKINKRMNKLNIELVLGSKVKEVKKKEVITKDNSIKGDLIIWCGGVEPNKLLIDNEEFKGVEVDEFLKFREDIFAIGDFAITQSPRLAQIAEQQGRIVSKNMIHDNKKYSQKIKGLLMSVGNNYALAQVGKINLSGYPAWLLWKGFYISKVRGIKNKKKVFNSLRKK